MERGQNEMQSELPRKKELKKQLTDKMETALPELKGMLGEKKFEHRIKKAAKLLMEGLHKDDRAIKKKQTAAKDANIKKTADKKTKKTTAKEANIKAKKTGVKKVAKAAPTAKAKAAKKKTAGKQ